MKIKAPFLIESEIWTKRSRRYGMWTLYAFRLREYMRIEVLHSWVRP